MGICDFFGLAVPVGLAPFPDDLVAEIGIHSFIGFQTHNYFSKDEIGRKGLSFGIIIVVPLQLERVLCYFLLVIVCFHKRLPGKLTFISKSVFFSWRRSCRPRRQKNYIISKKSLFCRVDGFFSIEDTSSIRFLDVFISNWRLSIR